MNKWKRLQNGSDIRGVALEGIPEEPVTLTPSIARTIGFAFGTWLQKQLGKNNLRIAVGHDSRLSAKSIQQALFQGLEKSGCSLFDAGLASTPAMFMSTIFEKHAYDGSVMLTASHLPFNRNGMKFFTKEGGLEKNDIQTILEIAAEKKEWIQNETVQAQAITLMDDYSSHLVETIRKGAKSERPLEGLKIVVDAGNGAGGFFVDRVLKPLGANTQGSQFLDPDGSFPNHIPNPEDAEAMEAIKTATIKNHADLGVIFDTDVDRAGAVDKHGTPINRNRFIALMSCILLEEHPGTTIVTDSVTSTGLKWWIEQHLKGTHHRFQRGYRNVINEAIRLNKEGKASWLAMETSGHGALKENYWLDDGAYQIAKILIKMARLKEESGTTVDELIAELPEPAEALEFRPKILKKEFSAYADRILEAFRKFAENQPDWILTTPNYEGVHVTTPHGWILVRKSLHDPQIPINVESDLSGGATTLKKILIRFLSSFDGLSL